MKLIAHACGPTLYPSNTIFSAREALKNGADLVELDLQYTSDQRLAVFHDKDLMKKYGDPRRCCEVTAEEFLSLRLKKDPACPSHLLDHFFRCEIAPILLHAPVEYLERLFTGALADPSVAALSIGTRPDCLPDEVVQLLSRLNRVKPVWVELGLQTIHADTARYIRRGYDLSVYEDALRRLKAAGLTVIVHVILGLPGEDREKMLATIDYLGGEHRPDGIKLQLLHVLDGTDLAEEYRAGRFRTMEMAAYFDILFECLERLPPDMVIHRLTGDGPKRLLLAPLWTANKKRVLNELNRELARRDIRQGRRYT